VTVEEQRAHVSRGRRRFLQDALLLAAPALGLCAVSMPLNARGKSPQAGGNRATGAGAISVRDHGATGDGVHDDTAAFQKAIDALPGSGGTVTVPAGNYMIDATRAINLRSNTRLEMDPKAQLSAMANSLPRSHVIKVWAVDNVQIVGGRIVGERAAHKGSTGEWGYGINIQAANNVTVTDTHVSDCWGDGFWIGAIGKGDRAVVSTGVTLLRVTSTNNRRQGLSIGPVQGVSVVDSTFSNSNGTKPQAGIDIEPLGQGTARDITIRNCTITGNRGTGLEMHDHVVGVVVTGCTIEGNNGYGMLGVGPTQLTIANNTVTGNGLVGVVMAAQTSHAHITGNTVSGNSARYLHHLAQSLISAGAGQSTRDLRVDDSTNDITVSGNSFQP
jgi:parallel beta-helix repeat protein